MSSPTLRLGELVVDRITNRDRSVLVKVDKVVRTGAKILRQKSLEAHHCNKEIHRHKGPQNAEGRLETNEMHL
jgi:hypothetical protein